MCFWWYSFIITFWGYFVILEGCFVILEGCFVYICNVLLFSYTLLYLGFFSFSCTFCIFFINIYYILCYLCLYSILISSKWAIVNLDKIKRKGKCETAKLERVSLSQYWWNWRSVKFFGIYWEKLRKAAEIRNNLVLNLLKHYWSACPRGGLSNLHQQAKSEVSTKTHNGLQYQRNAGHLGPRTTRTETSRPVSEDKSARKRGQVGP